MVLLEGKGREDSFIHGGSSLLMHSHLSHGLSSLWFVYYRPDPIDTCDMMYVEQKLNKPDTKNPLVKCGFKCCHCCLLCLEKCMKYISRNAYISVIMRGNNFFSAACYSFGLLAANLLTVGVLKSVSTLFIWMGTISNCLM